MSDTVTFSIVHQFMPGTSGRTVLLLDGRHVDESMLHSIGRALDPEAALLVPRITLSGEQDLIGRAHELAHFIERAAAHYELEPKRVIALASCEGATLAAATMLLHPGVVCGAALLRPKMPPVPERLPDLQGAPILICAGNQDPIVPAENVRELAALLRRSGADVTVCFENAEHGLTESTVTSVQRWLLEKAA